MQKGSKPKVVIDTNLLVSAAIIQGNLPGQLVTAWKKEQFILLISEPMLVEIKDVATRERIKRKYPLFLKRVTELIENIELGAELIKPFVDKDLPLHCRDQKDDMLLACAFGGNADYLVTRDEDLLVLRGNPALGTLQIITVSEILHS